MPTESILPEIVVWFRRDLRLSDNPALGFARAALPAAFLKEAGRHFYVNYTRTPDRLGASARGERTERCPSIRDRGTMTGSGAGRG